MKISIVTISYNQAQFLEQAILSVLNQDYSDIEYIVVDPGSADGSREIIRKYADRIDHIIFEPDRGPADGLNKGFALADGEIFCFLNSDDVLMPGVFTQVAQYFKNHPTGDVVSGHSWIIDADGYTRRRFYSDRFSLTMAAYGASILSQASTFFRAEAFRRGGGFNIENRLSWDGEMFIDMARAGMKFSLVPEFWSCFRVYGESITGSGKFRALHKQNNEKIFIKILGRKPNFKDRFFAVCARLARKFLNPLDSFERFRYGPIAK